MRLVIGYDGSDGADAAHDDTPDGTQAASEESR